MKKHILKQYIYHHLPSLPFFQEFYWDCSFLRGDKLVDIIIFETKTYHSKEKKYVSCWSDKRIQYKIV